MNSAIKFAGYNQYAKISNINAYSVSNKTIMFWMNKLNDFILDTYHKNNVEGLLGKSIDTGTKRDYTFAISNITPPFDIYAMIGLQADTLVMVGKKNFIEPGI